MRLPSREQVEWIRKIYPAGTKVKLVRMSDPQSPPAGTIGEVIAVDDLGDLVMRWSNGSGLNVVPGEDIVEKL